MSNDNQWGQQQEPQDAAPTRMRSQQPPAAPYPPSYAEYQAAQPRKRHTGRTVLISILGTLAALLVIGAIASAGKSTSSATTATPTAGAHQAAAPASSAHSAAAAPAKTVVLRLSGTDLKSTRSFTVGADWSLAYSYDCASFGQAGNFQVYEDYPSANILVNALSIKGQDVTYQHNDAGTHSLEVSSECSWTITVTDGDTGQ